MFSDPEQNVRQLHLTEGMRVADFGAGSGAYSFALAERVGSSGKVYAIDVQKEVLARIENEARARRASVKTVWADLDTLGGSKLADGSVDAVVVSNILFQSEVKDVIAKEIYRILKKGGDAMVVDWSDSFGNLGPVQSAVVTENAGRQIFERVGFAYVRSFTAGAHHWGFICKKT